MAKDTAKRIAQETEHMPAPAHALPGAIDIAPIDRTIHERTRLAIVSALAANPAVTFSELRQMLDVTDGNLSVHARKLEDAGYVQCKKSFANRKPRSEYKLTKKGREALSKYLDHMEAVIRQMRGS